MNSSDGGFGFSGEEDAVEQPAAKNKLGWRTRWWVFTMRVKELWLRATAPFVYWRIRRKQASRKTSVTALTREQAERCRLIDPRSDADQYPLDSRLTFNMTGKDVLKPEKLSDGELRLRSRKMLEAMSIPRPHNPNQPDPLKIMEDLKNENH